MRSPTQPTHFDDSFHRRRWGDWVAAGLIAAGLNLVLFWLMPHLVDPAPGPSSIETLVSQINVIRMPKPDTEIRRKPSPPPKPPVTKPVQAPDATPRQVMQHKLTLPFEVNPRLPAGPNSLVLPPLAYAPLASPAPVQGTFTASQLDGPLTTLTRIPPVYPIQARRRGIEGWVKVTFIVDETGRVGSITILAAEPPGLFDSSVRRCVRDWRFKPGTVEGVPVKAKVETVIRFELE